MINIIQLSYPFVCWMLGLLQTLLISVDINVSRSFSQSISQQLFTAIKQNTHILHEHSVKTSGNQYMFCVMFDDYRSSDIDAYHFV